MTKETEALLALDARHIWHPFTQAATAPPPLLIKEAEGATLIGADGTRYLDLVSSWWVNMHGHAHQVIARAIAEQASRLEHVIFAGFTHEPAIELARRLVALAPPGLTRVFYSDNGSTAVEVALKIAYQYWRNRGAKERRRFIAFEGGYHGDTVGAMSAGRSSGFYLPFEDLLFEVDTVPFPATWEGDEGCEGREAQALAALDRLLQNGERYAAAIIEPLVQGASGMRMCRPEFLRAAAERLKRAGVLLICDEVMTGFGRTGTMFASARAGITPDLMCVAKGITGGFVPLGATLAREELYAEFLGETVDRAFLHGHSYTANPIGCAAGIASLDVFEVERTLERVAAIERAHRDRIGALAPRGIIERARVLGSIAAFDVPARDTRYGSAIGSALRAEFLKRGLVLRPLGNVVYLMPPYCITAAELGAAYDTMADVILALA